MHFVDGGFVPQRSYMTNMPTTS